MKTLLLGDICPTIQTKNDFATANVDSLFSDAIRLFRSVDFSFVNLECAITESENRIEKFGPNLKAPYGTEKVLSALGVSLVGLSNNHIFDFGIEGATDTKRALAEMGIPYTGYGNNYEDARRDYVVSFGGERITFITVCEHEYSYALDNREGSRPIDDFDTLEDISKAKAKGGKVIVIYHGGKEYCRYPSPRLRKLCRAMVKCGADVVLCQHSHCVGCYEEFLDSHILYGQGNFHFAKADFVDKSIAPLWNNSLAVLYDTLTNEMNFVPLVETATGIEIAKGERAKEILSGFASRNEELRNGAWLEGWHDFCESQRDWYTHTVARAFAEGSSVEEDNIFGHYLDCEAHTDVYRELFKTANHKNEIGK